MSQENIRLAYGAVDAMNERDLDAYLVLMDEDVEVASRIAAMEGGLHGHDGIRRWWDTRSSQPCVPLAMAGAAASPSKTTSGAPVAGETVSACGGRSSTPRRRPSKPSRLRSSGAVQLHVQPGLQLASILRL